MQTSKITVYEDKKVEILHSVAPESRVATLSGIFGKGQALTHPHIDYGGTMRVKLYDILASVHRCIQAKAELSINTLWVDGPLAHCSDTMLSITAVAERILQDGESIEKITEITWQNICRGDIEIIVFEGKLAKVPCRDNGFHLYGELQTTHGRTLSFLAAPTGGHYMTHRGQNWYVGLGTLRKVDSKEQQTVLRVEERPNTESMRDVNNSLSLRVACTLELIAIILHSTTDGRPGVIGRISNISIPKSGVSLMPFNRHFRAKQVGSATHTGSKRQKTHVEMKLPWQKSTTEVIAFLKDHSV